MRFGYVAAVLLFTAGPAFAGPCVHDEIHADHNAAAAAGNRQDARQEERAAHANERQAQRDAAVGDYAGAQANERAAQAEKAEAGHDARVANHEQHAANRETNDAEARGCM